MEFDPHRLYCRHRLDNGSSTAGEGLVNGPARGRLPPSLEDARIANRIVSAHQDHLRGHLGPATGSAPSAPCHSTQPAGKPDSVIRMGLRGSGLRDADLAVVVQKMESRLQTGVSAGSEQPAMRQLMMRQPMQEVQRMAWSWTCPATRASLTRAFGHMWFRSLHDGRSG